jgi:hypothetical protein
MSFFNTGFDAAKVEPQSFEPLPEGEYIAIVEKAEEKLTKDKNGAFLNLRIKVVDGKFKNRTVFKNINLKNASATAQAIGLGELSALCRAVGVLQPRNAFELCNRPLKIKVRHKPDRDGRGLVNDVFAFAASATQAPQVRSPAIAAAPGPVGDAPPWA